jgi:hypothetical protein
LKESQSSTFDLPPSVFVVFVSMSTLFVIEITLDVLDLH